MITATSYIQLRVPSGISNASLQSHVIAKTKAGCCKTNVSQRKSAFLIGFKTAFIVSLFKQGCQGMLHAEVVHLPGSWGRHGLQQGPT